MMPYQYDSRRLLCLAAGGFDPSARADQAAWRESPLPLHSRVHRLYLHAGAREHGAWVKRDDELSFGASGSKVRKYSSLLPDLVRQWATHGVVIGGQNSNNVLAAVQYLPEHGITPVLVLREQRDRGLPGIISMLITHMVAERRVHLVQRSAWPEAYPLACDRAVEQVKADGGSPYVIPEGASCAGALPGSMTLGIDIEENERQSGRRFDNVFIEAGSGLSSLALALYWELAGQRRNLYILCTAIGRDELLSIHRHWIASLGMAKSHVNIVARQAREGSAEEISVNDLSETRAAGQRNGIIFDPYYSGRLLRMMSELVAQGAVVPEASLMIHTGGGLGLLRYLVGQRPSLLTADRNA